ncbi:MAG: tRNA (N(6)-L-threonylcarbamoyladenosine(37)-C(2))-methylthiotransferase MtaB [Bacteroidota bacterium]|nr:tRNA (N(6)-L-threonylcarbamoyladenosine(37)-C(2))-methylthiotransferase MtaB [Bacteroidota bacterium]MDP3147297.1 tRNA (N(6)-L-threonylcarbamoyladenosine(37)-C(2))-methylthiotransferase MtaB [Bacteroidota bacterium]MDP3557329.1 tRNA (N(6)-L-threonylcarbamoyladenosine(37)-C(2))-methylthiotransferase MtaB [Bacteroidota bacterium]
MSFQDKTVAFHTLGCKLNFSETSTIARLFQEKGFIKKDFSEAVDVYVINTCSVTENADKECKSIVKNALAKNPEAFIAVVGCYAQLKPEEISKIEGVDVVLGATEKFKLLNYINFSGKSTHTQIHNCEISEADFFVDSYSVGDRTRSFLKVQDGCDYSCTFCTIPLARGKSRSDTIENVIKNVNKIAATGVKEIVLTGVNIGDFGYGQNIDGDEKKRKEYNFLDLINEIDKTNNIERFRISSIEPNLLKDEIIEFVASSSHFVPHFHIPLQSGNNAVLKRMKRRYQRELYSDRILKIKNLMPDCCIGVDVIVGFPGETEEEFLDTYNFVNGLNVSYLHVFTYSERDNTEAIEMENPVPIVERKRRNKMLRILSAKKLRAFYETQKGKELSVIFEHENKNGFMFGFTQNYVKVKYPFDVNLCNTPITVTVGDFDEEGNMSCALKESVLA